MSVADNVSESFESLPKFLTSMSYAAGALFSVESIEQFKAQSSDNPTSIPIGTPVALLFAAAALTVVNAATTTG